MTRVLTLALALAACACLLFPGDALAQISVRSELSDDRDALPGTSYSGTILVRNETNTTQQAKVYQSDYLFYRDGTNLFAEPGSTPRSNARWIRFSPAVMTIPPGQMLPVQYTVVVPASTQDAPLEGSYWSVLMVEGIAAGSAESTLPSPDGEPKYAVTQQIRYGVQIATHIAGTGSDALRFVEADLVLQDDGKKSFLLDIQNEGSRLVRPAVRVELYDDLGSRVGERTAVRSRVYPGTSIRTSFDLSSLPSGTYQALVILDAGEDDIYGARYTLEL